MSKPKKIWDNCILIGEVRKSNAKKTIVELVARDGVKYINVRDWYLRKRDNEWRPSSAGLAIPISVPIDGEVTNVMENIMVLFKEGIEKAEDFAIEDEENAVWK